MASIAASSHIKPLILRVMAGLVPAIHAFLVSKDVDARDKRGHDALEI
jgi:hypothetical protein